MGLSEDKEVTVDLFEHQGLALFARHGLPVLDGDVARTSGQAREIAARLGGRVVIKAQVRTGGRGKAGGVKLASDAHEAEARSAEILGMSINGHTVGAVLVTRAADIVEEYYFSYLLDRTNRTFLCIASVSGGMDIEQIAHQAPDRVLRMPIDGSLGVDLATAQEIVAKAGFPDEVSDQVVDSAMRLWRAFVAEDATLVEVNPMARLSDGTVRCLDAKVTLDDNARFRHPDHVALADEVSADPLERLAAERKLNYVRLDGQVGVIGNGAGLVMSTLDVVASAGADLGIRPANFLDIGGGASAVVMADALDTVLADSSVRTVLVNVFGGITACDAVAHGILRGIELMSERGEDLRIPLVVRLDGNRADEGRRILDSAAHPFIERVDTMDGAARRAAERASAAGV